ncbi:hypothetical protein LCGC14_0657740 [marine sediment metagenome]|uniref:Uncharacterized protein n=1 Tax=marine sediment metagenome TaxID=412755 RepID=A0A0F9QUJ9_9ZZZZ
MVDRCDRGVIQDGVDMAGPHFRVCPGCQSCKPDVHRAPKSGMHMWAIDCVKVDAWVEALEIEQGRYDCDLTDGWVSIDLECDRVEIACYKHFWETQKTVLVEALRALGIVYGDTGWHYFACPTRHGFKDCDKKCLDAQVALEGTK